MRKSKTKSKSMQKADRHFSFYIRTRDTDQRGYGHCITCDKTVHLSEADCGHFISRGNQSVRYDERNSNLQCRKCNRFESGRQYEHGKAIDLKWGKGTADELLRKSRELCKRTQADFEEIAQHYKDQI
jgi:hypothetical protein